MYICIYICIYVYMHIYIYILTNCNCYYYHYYHLLFKKIYTGYIHTSVKAITLLSACFLENSAKVTKRLKSQHNEIVLEQDRIRN